MRQIPTIIVVAITLLSSARGQTTAPSTRPGVAAFPHIQVDIPKKQLRIECEALHCEAPLEHFCVVKGGSEHESVIRTLAKPSQIHTGLLMIGLEPGEPLKYIEATKQWIPPHGPALNISMEFDKDGKHYSMPAWKLLREVKTKKTAPEMKWVFAGSKVMSDGNYAADIEGYVVSIVNFDLTMIDVPKLASSDNETLEWEADLSQLPPLGGAMTMIIEPGK